MIQPEFSPLLGIGPISRPEGDGLLTKWEHPLGPCRRPFGVHHWLMEVKGRPVALATTASIVSGTVEEYRRGEVIELARLARDPDQPWALRPMLRLWREVLGPAWPYWPARAAVAYALPGTPGDLYRFDGWTRIGTRRRSGGGGTWTLKDPAVSQIGDGIKTLWMWTYPA